MKKLVFLTLFILLSLQASAWAQDMGAYNSNSAVVGQKYRLYPYGAYPNGNPYPYGGVPPQNDPNTATVGRPYYGYPGYGYDPNYTGGVQTTGDSVSVPGR